jgi:hypothetical protein
MEGRQRSLPEDVLIVGVNTYMGGAQDGGAAGVLKISHLPYHKGS